MNKEQLSEEVPSWTYKDWVRYSENKPTEAGLYEWRIHSKTASGLIMIVLATIRLRGAGFKNALSPEFDYWDGHQVHVKSNVEWRPTDIVLLKNQRTPLVLSFEGLDISPCSYCGKVPQIEAHQRDNFGVTFNPYPWFFNSWRFVCCEWGTTPRMSDPRDIERIRRETRCPVPSFEQYK